MKEFFKKNLLDGRKVFLIGSILAILFLLLGGSFVFGKVFTNVGYFSDLKIAFLETFKETFGVYSGKPAFEIDLALKESELGGVGARQEEGSGPKLNFGNEKNNQVANILNIQSSLAGNSDLVSNNEDVSQENNMKESNTLDEQEVSLLLADKPQIKECDFYVGKLSNRKVLFNEIAWMGTDLDSNNEWVELFNNSNEDLNLFNWKILNETGKIRINFPEGSYLPRGSFYLLERTDDDSVENISADYIYKGSLSNNGEWLRIFDGDCNLVDEVNASVSLAQDGKSGWESLGGDNNSKRTLERNLNNFGWQTSFSPGGTPKKSNSSGLAVAEDSYLGLEPVLNSEPEPASLTSPEVSETSTPSSTDEGVVDPPSSPPSIFVTEIMAGSSVSNGDEFIEIYNYGNEPVDLTGWTIKKKSSGGNESSLVVASRLSGKVVQPGKYLLLAHEGGYTGVVSPDVLWPGSYSLAYTNNSITIYNASGGVADQVAWTEIPKDKSYMRQSMDISAGFAVSDTPSPQNGQ